MKVRELINLLQNYPNQNADVQIHVWMLAKKSDKVIISITKPTDILKPLNGDEVVAIETKPFEEDI